MSDIATVADRIAIQDVMSNYAAGVDERDLERYRRCSPMTSLLLGLARESPKALINGSLT